MILLASRSPWPENQCSMVSIFRMSRVDVQNLWIGI